MQEYFFYVVEFLLEKTNIYLKYELSTNLVYCQAFCW